MPAATDIYGSSCARPSAGIWSPGAALMSMSATRVRCACVSYCNIYRARPIAELGCTCESVHDLWCSERPTAVSNRMASSICALHIIPKSPYPLLTVDLIVHSVVESGPRNLYLEAAARLEVTTREGSGGTTAVMAGAPEPSEVAPPRQRDRSQSTALCNRCNAAVTSQSRTRRSH